MRTKRANHERVTPALVSAAASEWSKLCKAEEAARKRYAQLHNELLAQQAAEAEQETVKNTPLSEKELAIHEAFKNS